MVHGWWIFNANAKINCPARSNTENYDPLAAFPAPANSLSSSSFTLKNRKEPDEKGNKGRTKTSPV
jgi:hypothetical protein